MGKLKTGMTQLINKMDISPTPKSLPLFYCTVLPHLKNNQATQVGATVTKQNLSPLLQRLALTSLGRKAFISAPSKGVGDEPQILPNLVSQLEVFFIRKNRKAGIHHLLVTFLFLF